MNNLKKMMLSAVGISFLLCGCGKKVAPADNSGIAIENSTAGSTESLQSESTSSDSTGISSEENTELTTSAQEGTTSVITEEASEQETTEGETEEASENVQEEEIPSSVEELMEEMTLREKVCQMFIVTPEQLTGYGCVTYADSVVQQSFMNTPVGGVILFSQNLTYQDQTSQLIASCQDYAADSCGAGIFVAVDEEGGTVARAAEKLRTTAFSDMAYYGQMNDPQQAYNIGSTIGSDLSALGFNVDFAPVADVNLNPGNELGNRIFSSDPEVVSTMTANVVRGLQDQGVCATLKHFPGLGAADGNTHNDNYVHIYKTIDELREAEFVAFSGGIEAGADFVMVGHQKVSGVGDDLPADLSYTVVTTLLREELGFQGIAVTDAQQMNTIAGVYGSGDAAVRSVEAGIDIILMPADLNAAVDAICYAVEEGRLTEERIDESVVRILNQKAELGLLDIQE